MPYNHRGQIIRYCIHGFQWAAIVIAFVLIFGLIIGQIYFQNPHDQIGYIQKLFFISGIGLALQACFGHKMPLFTGPAAVLLIGILASQSHDPAATYTAIFLGGVVLTILAASGIIEHVRHFFTSRIIAAILLLISFSLIPTILNLITSPRNGGGIGANIVFAFCFILVIFLLYRTLKGLWNATMVIWSLILGFISYSFIFPIIPVPGTYEIFAVFAIDPILPLTIDIGVIIAFFFCYIALLMNDIGAIQSLEPLFLVEHMKERTQKGVFVTGITNILSGLFGVIGGVNYSLSAGMILATGSASRYPLFPAAGIVILCSMSPFIIANLLLIPPVVIGCMLLFIMTSQFAAALIVAIEGDQKHTFQLEDGLIIGLPILFGTMMAFLPQEIIATLPYLAQPICGNGFVPGVLSAFIMEHIIFKSRNANTEKS